MYAQIAGRFIKRRDWMRCVEDNLEHIYEQLFHKTLKTGTCRDPTPLAKLYGERTKLENWRLVDLDGTGWIPGGDAGLFLDVKDLSAADPV